MDSDPKFFKDDCQNSQNPFFQKIFDALNVPKEHSSIMFFNLDRENYLVLKEKADNGSADAQFKTGYCYEKGQIVKQSYKSAFHYYKLAADQGHRESQVFLAMLYDDGLGVKQDYQQAFYYYNLAADQKSSIALARLGEFYEKGKGVQKSSDMAIYYYKLAADQGNSLGQYLLASYLLENKINEEQAVCYLKLILQKQHRSKLLARCEYDLGECFEKGTGIKKSLENALYYYTIASQHDNILAQDRLGDAYLKGELGLKKSPEKAIEYYQLAAKHGYSSSLEVIGRCYEKGEGVEQSPETAFYYYKLAAEIDIKKGYSSSIYALARSYEQGIGTEKSLENAIYYYKFAAENGFTLGYYSAGCCYKEMGGEENAKKAVAYFKMAALGNNPLALVKLAELSEEVKDYKIAFEYYKKAADQGYLTAQRELGLFYENGRGVTKSIEEAFKYYRLAADQGDPIAQYCIGNLYQWGKGVEQSKEESLKYYRVSADQEYGPALIELAHYYGSEELKDYKKSFEYYKIASDHGYPEAQRELGHYYENGRGVEKSDEEALKYYRLAVEYYKKAADQGYAEAQCKLGLFYENGWGVEKSVEVAFEYYRLAADQGDSIAQFFIGNLYELGKSIHQSREESLKYYKLAADQEFGPALIRLADYYYSGEGKDYKKSFEYYKKAADQGYTEAQCDLGLQYEYGEGVEKNISKAIYYYKLAADQGYNRALCNLAMCYENGTGVKKSSGEAFVYFKKSADQNYARGQFNVARCYRGGIGVKYSLEKAIEYYELALAQDYKKDEILKQIRLCKNELQGNIGKELKLLEQLCDELEIKYFNIKKSLSSFHKKMENNKNARGVSFEHCLKFYAVSIRRVFSTLEKNLEELRILHSKSEELLSKNHLTIISKNSAEGNKYRIKNTDDLKAFSGKLKELEVEIGLLKSSYTVKPMVVKRNLCVSAHLKNIFKRKYIESACNKNFSLIKVSLFPAYKFRKTVCILQASIRNLNKWLGFILGKNKHNDICESINALIYVANQLITEALVEFPNFEELNKKIDEFNQQCNEIYPIIKEVYFSINNDKNVV